jgi:hypothetical protein
MKPMKTKKTVRTPTKYMNSPNGVQLKRAHDMDETGVWHVMTPGIAPASIGYLEGTLEEVVEAAVDMHGFWEDTDGLDLEGGTIRKEHPPRVRTIKQYHRYRMERERLINEQLEIVEKIQTLEEEEGF